MKGERLDELDEWRKKIDAVDLQLVKLLNDRAHYAAEIGNIKLGLGLGAYTPEREEEIMKNVTDANGGPLSAQAIRRLFERIVDESRAVERTAMMKKNDPTPPKNT
ncbi:MAG TPA: chorismate mutase [Bacteroidota bacterium]|nr:chorismate mutase [Bacteroidota bacterium]